MFLFSLHTHRKRPLQNAAAVSSIAGISPSPAPISGLRMAMPFPHRYPGCHRPPVPAGIPLPVGIFESRHKQVPSEKQACRGLCFSPYRSSPGPAAGGIFPLFSQAGNVHKFSPVSGSFSRSTRPGSSRTAISQVALIRASFKWPPKTRPRTSPALMCRWA